MRGPERQFPRNMSGSISPRAPEPGTGEGSRGAPGIPEASPDLQGFQFKGFTAKPVKIQIFGAPGWAGNEKGTGLRDAKWAWGWAWEGVYGPGKLQCIWTWETVIWAWATVIWARGAGIRAWGCYMGLGSCHRGLGSCHVWLGHCDVGLGECHMSLGKCYRSRKVLYGPGKVLYEPGKVFYGRGKVLYR